MTFTYHGADLATTIKRYKQTGNYYHIEYLDGSFSDYYCSDQKESERIEAIMKKQAIDRENLMDIEEIIRTKHKDLAGASLTFLSSSFLYNYEKFSLCALTMAGAGICLKCATTKSSRIRELKKYKLFLEIDKNLSNINECELLSEVEPDHIYQVPLTISHVDDYSYREIKVLYKKMNRMIRDQKSNL